MSARRNFARVSISASFLTFRHSKEFSYLLFLASLNMLMGTVSTYISYKLLTQNPDYYCIDIYGTHTGHMMRFAEYNV